MTVLAFRRLWLCPPLPDGRYCVGHTYYIAASGGCGGEEEEEEVVTKMWLNTAAAFTITEPSFYHTTAREHVVMSLIGFSQYISFMIYSIESASDLMTLVFF